MTLDQLQSALPEYFAPWVQALGLDIRGAQDGKSACCASTTYALL